MMTSLFEGLNSAMSGSVGLALAGSFVWGVLSIVLSPCHLASIPLVVGFVGGQGSITQRRAAALSGLFATGILLTIVGLGVVTTVAGRIAGDLGPWAYYAVAAVFFVVGLYLLGVFDLPWSGTAGITTRRRGAAAALMLGLLFGLALGPCTFAYMAPVLGITFKVAGSQPLLAGLLLLMFALGHCAVIVLAGSAGRWVQRYLDWNQRSGWATALRRCSGAGVLLAGLYLVYVSA
jgi:cytochrome c-type biogenesis protein